MIVAQATGQIFTSEVGLINDPDGYTFIREDNNNTSKVLDTIFQGEFFHYTPSKDNWWKAGKLWYTSGYMHSSRIVNIKDLPIKEKNELIDSIFNIEIELSSISFYEKTEFERENSKRFWEEKYTRILEMFAEYICETKDKGLFEKFKTILYRNGGSVDETPSWTLGMIFVCQPDWTIKMVTTATGYSALKKELEWGFLNVVPFEEGSDEYNVLLNKLNTIK